MSYNDLKPWFALQVAPRAEKKVAASLVYKGYECFLPLYKASRRWSDRNKIVELPLLPGYVFCRMLEASSGFVLATPGTVRIVSFGGKAYPVSETEIVSLQQIVRSGVGAIPFVPFLRIGQRVEVKSGPLMGVSGIVLQIKNHRRLILSVDLVMKSIAVDVDAYEVAYLPSRKDTHYQMGPDREAYSRQRAS